MNQKMSPRLECALTFDARRSNIFITNFERGGRNIGDSMRQVRDDLDWTRKFNAASIQSAAGRFARGRSTATNECNSWRDKIDVWVDMRRQVIPETDDVSEVLRGHELTHSSHATLTRPVSQCS
jgi:hypothetical protein